MNELKQNQLKVLTRWVEIIGCLLARWTGSMLRMRQIDEYQELMQKMDHRTERNSLSLLDGVSSATNKKIFKCNANECWPKLRYSVDGGAGKKINIK